MTVTHTRTIPMIVPAPSPLFFFFVGSGSWVKDGSNVIGVVGFVDADVDVGVNVDVDADGGVNVDVDGNTDADIDADVYVNDSLVGLMISMSYEQNEFDS